MNDIINRLRAHHSTDYMCQDCYGSLMDEAANIIEELCEKIDGCVRVAADALSRADVANNALDKANTTIELIRLGVIK